MGWCRRRLSEVLTSRSFARIRFEIVMRLNQKRPVLVCPGPPAQVGEAKEVERLGLPSGRDRPSAFGMYTRRDGLAR